MDVLNGLFIMQPVVRPQRQKKTIAASNPAQNHGLQSIQIRTTQNSPTCLISTRAFDARRCAQGWRYNPNHHGNSLIHLNQNLYT